MKRMHEEAPACAHGHDVDAFIAPPRHTEPVYKDECMFCYDSPDSPRGLAVCLACFQGYCIGDGSQQHIKQHYEKSGHSIVMVLHRERNEAAPVTRLAVVERPDEEESTYTMEPRSLCGDAAQGTPLPRTEKLENVMQAVLRASSSAQRDEVQAWEEDIVPCEHTNHLVQEDSQMLQLDSAKCAACDLTSNLWLCLSCGYLGCGRAQFGGVDGHSHALAHFDTSGHSCCVKQGTITPEGTGDVYCYACNEPRVDTTLSTHLQHFGIHVLSLNKTEKNMTELQLEQNIAFDFTMTGDDGHPLTPISGPGLTGIQNLGNTCYMASVLQCVFSLRGFRERYWSQHAAHIAACEKMPAACLECQLGKFADGLYSGRYPQGIKPGMLKKLLGTGHHEFASMRQQDADEFLLFLLPFLQSKPHEPFSLPDPAAQFGYVLEQRLQCTQCKKVRYTEENVDAGLSLPVPVQEEPSTESETGSVDDKRYKPVTLEESLDLFTHEEVIEYHCPSCAQNVAATKRMRFASFPAVFVVQAQRFQLVNWVPQKVNVPLVVPVVEPVDLVKYKGYGLQPGEEALPQDTQAPEYPPAALEMLIAMGFSENRCKRALDATGSGDPEAAANWLFERMDDSTLDAPLTVSASPDTTMLEEMGFSKAQATKALRMNNGNAEIAVAWLFENPDDPGEEPGAGEAQTARPGSTEDEPLYQLSSFVSHKGPSVHSGHYVAHVDKHLDNAWAFFNDEKVVSLPVDTVDASNVRCASQFAYLYFFQRI
ncbi:ubiquitinyl hydrolase 1 [Malassezia vespertilionis]|uniref:ubiquitinyl hydrolase 1 n=1 Tax=Malassezia vespertilionis TaxID=2020962 RepID=UPI0024B0F3B9|nr:ubiquitinyl hydrolase 1 [Malassezia vespertilionis]WFD08409.1 ubiquitinyl hydrolase 1 [Malassezia vespertilionis]